MNTTLAKKSKQKKRCLRCNRAFWTANERKEYHTSHCAKMAYFDRQKEKIRQAEDILRQVAHFPQESN